MVKTRALILLIVVCSAAAGSVVSAQTPPGAQPNLETTLQPGMTVWITQSGGREKKARVVGVSGDVVTTSAGGDMQRLRTTDIIRVRARRSDTVINGALIGAAGAVASGLFLCRLTEPWEICRDPGPILRIGAVGAGLGIGMDALIRGRRTIYEAPPSTLRLRVAPTMAGRSTGVQVSFSFQPNASGSPRRPAVVSQRRRAAQLAK
jgi:hypothetical protein